MEGRFSVNSQRRILSFSKNRRANVLFSDAYHRSPTELGVSGEHGPKLSEVHGFVGSITTVVFTAPAYSVKYWALAVPTYVMVTIILAVTFYIGMNFMATPPPSSSRSMFDEFSREPPSCTPSADDDDDEQPIEPISDIGINQINQIMFNNPKSVTPTSFLSVEVD